MKTLPTNVFGYLVMLVFCAGVAARDADSAQEPPNLGVLKVQLKDYHSREYALEVATVLSEAGKWIKKRAPQVKNPAIVLDVDETSLSNWEQLVANDFAFIPNGLCSVPAQMPCGNSGWDQSLRATAIQPTLQLFQDAKKMGVAIFFITGRFDDPVERSATELNLWLVGYRGWEKLYMRQDRAGTVSAFKTGARETIEHDGYTIIANVGDQRSDLEGGHAEKTFKVPNPFYFIP